MTSAEQYVAGRLIRLSLRPDGRLPKSMLLAATTRAALLSDLALRGALATSPDGLELDTTPTGFPPADKLLAGVAAQPDNALEWWVRRGIDSVRDVVTELVHTGSWIEERHHRYRDTQPSSVRADALLLDAVLGGAVPATPATAVLAALLGVIGTTDRPGGRHPSEADLAACGPAGWLVADLVDYLLQRRRLLDAAAADARAALTVNLIQ